MARTAADVLVDTIHDWGVDTIFGLPGDGINGIREALRKRQDQIRFIQVRHEEAAAFMACGYAKFSGRLGVCLATSGPGGIHLLNGLYDAKLDQVPVLAITGMAFHDLVDTLTQQDVELDKLYMDVAAYNTRIMGKTTLKAWPICTRLSQRSASDDSHRHSGPGDGAALQAQRTDAHVGRCCARRTTAGRDRTTPCR